MEITTGIPQDIRRWNRAIPASHGSREKLNPAPETGGPIPCYRLLMLRQIGVVFAVCSVLVSFSFAKERYQQPGPIHLDREGEKWAEKTLRKLSTEEKVGQLFMVWARAQFLNADSDIYVQLKEAIDKYHVGAFAMTIPVEGAFLIKSEPYEATMLLNHLQEESKLPLLFAADFERGLTMRLNGPTAFPHAMAFGAAG